MKKTFKISAVFLMFFGFLEFAFAGPCSTPKERQCLKDTINCEARNQDYSGMLLVAKTVATRFARGTYGHTTCGITDGAAFCRRGSYPTKGGPIDVEANRNIELATKHGCTMGDEGITHFYKEGSIVPGWAKSNRFVLSHKRHLFYDIPGATAEMDERYISEEFRNDESIQSAELEEDQAPVQPWTPVAG